MFDTKGIVCELLQPVCQKSIEDELLKVPVINSDWNISNCLALKRVVSTRLGKDSRIIIPR